MTRLIRFWRTCRATVVTTCLALALAHVAVAGHANHREFQQEDSQSEGAQTGESQPSGSRAEEDVGPAPTSHAFDVLFLGDRQRLLLRVDMSIADRPLTEVWLAGRDQTLAFLDQNDNGQLELDEWNRADWTGSAASRRGSTLLGSFLDRVGLRSTPGDDGVLPAVMPIESFEMKYEEAFPQLRLLGVTLPQYLGSDLWSVIDQDEDGAIRRDEIDNLQERLHRLDRNEDGAISYVELQQFANPFSFNTGFSRAGLAPPVSFLVLRPGGIDAAVARLMAMSEEARSAASVPALDSIADAREWLEGLTPDLHLRLRLGESGESLGVEVLETVSHREDLRLATHEGQLVIETRNACLLFTGANPTGFDFTTIFSQQFDIVDADNNGYIDRDESASNGFFVSTFGSMDKDRDDKLYREEMESYVEHRQQRARTRIEWLVVDHGHRMFQLLDIDVDGRLGPRELMAAEDRWRSWDRDGDGRVTKEEIPQSHVIRYGPGQTESIGGFRFDSVRVGTTPVRYREPNGPDWFARQDRNRDGDVSRREFLGPVDLFDKFDADGDGLLDAQEAAAVDR